MWRDRRPKNILSDSEFAFDASNAIVSNAANSKEQILLTATSAQSVRLVMALSEAGSSLSCEYC